MKTRFTTLAVLAAVAMLSAASTVSAETTLGKRAVFAEEETTLMFSLPITSTSWPVLKIDFVGAGVSPVNVHPGPQGLAEWRCEKTISRSEDGQDPLVSTSLQCELLNSSEIADDRAYLPVKAVWPDHSIGTEQYLFAGDSSEEVQVLSNDDDSNDGSDGGGLSCTTPPFDPRCYLETQGDDGSNDSGWPCWTDPNHPRCWLDTMSGDGYYQTSCDTETLSISGDGLYQTTCDDSEGVRCYYIRGKRVCRM